MTRKLLLINPAQFPDNPKLNLAGAIRLPQSSLAYLAALTPQNWNVTILDENLAPLGSPEADLVGITAYTCNAPRGYEISDKYRTKGIKTVIGGVHASVVPEEAKQYADSVVVGEAESVWETLIKDLENNNLQKLYRGDRISLENLVKPDRSLLSKQYRLLSVETSRGCPNNCEFCSTQALYGRTYRQRPVDEVLDELETLRGRFFFFSDDNILGYGKEAEERAIELFRGMVERKLNKRWGAYIGIDFANNPDVLKHARKAGCLGVFIGFESINEEALHDMHKARNLKIGVGNYRDVVKRIHDHGIGIFGSFVLGNDGDYKDVFRKTSKFIMDSKIDIVQLSALTPYPGTRLYERLRKEGRLLRTNYPEDWRYYDFTEVVFQPKNMSPNDLAEGIATMYKHTTSTWPSLKRAFRSALETKNVFGSALAFAGNRGSYSYWMRKYNTTNFYHESI